MGRLRDPGEEEKGRDPGQRVRFQGVPRALGEKGGAGCSEEGPPPGRAAAPPAPPPGRRPRSSCPSGLGGRTGSEPSSRRSGRRDSGDAAVLRARRHGDQAPRDWPPPGTLLASWRQRESWARAAPSGCHPARFRRSGFLEFNCKGLRGETRAY